MGNSLDILYSICINLLKLCHREGCIVHLFFFFSAIWFNLTWIYSADIWCREYYLLSLWSGANEGIQSCFKVKLSHRNCWGDTLQTFLKIYCVTFCDIRIILCWNHVLETTEYIAKCNIRIYTVKTLKVTHIIQKVVYTN